MEALYSFLQEYYYLTVVFVVLIIAVFIYFSFQSKAKVRDTEKKALAYVKGLNELIAGNFEVAKISFLEAVKFDSENIDAYLKLGVIYREEGKFSKALKIHKELTIRSGIPVPLQADIYKNIVEDLIELRNYKEALINIDKLLNLDSTNKWALDNQPNIYALLKDWKNAFKFLKSNSKGISGVERRLALYKIANASHLIEINDYHDARLLLKDAIKLDPLYPPPYIMIGESYVSEDRIDDAVKFWKQFSEKVPEKSYLVFDLLEKAYYESGNFAAMEVFYSKVIENDSDNFKALNKLGEIYFKKGDRDKALELTERSLRINPKSPDGLKNLILYMNNASDLPVIKEKALSLARSISSMNSFRCRDCGSSYEDVLIKCPSCDGWDTFDY